MATDIRADLRKMIDALADEHLVEAREALARLDDAGNRRAQDDLDAWLVATGQMARVPTDADIADARDVAPLDVPVELPAGTWEEFDAWLIKSGLVSRLPQAAVNPPIERTPLLNVSGEPVSKTLVDERR